MKLLTKEILNKLPTLDAVANEADPIVQVKFFDPTGSFTWYAYAYDPTNRIFSGIVFSNMCPDGECGDFSLDELEHCKDGMRGLRALPIERDRSFRPTKLSECKNPSRG